MANAQRIGFIDRSDQAALRNQFRSVTLMANFWIVLSHVTNKWLSPRSSAVTDRWFEVPACGFCAITTTPEMPSRQPFSFLSRKPTPSFPEKWCPIGFAFAALGHGSEPRVLDDPVITAIATRLNKTPAQVLLAWDIQRRTALLTTATTLQADKGEL